MTAKKTIPANRQPSARAADNKKVGGNRNSRGAAKMQQASSCNSERKIVRRKSGAQRRDQILETARDLIFTEGFSNFTIREVASRVGISEAAIYRHYASKEELMLALLESLFSPWREEISKLVAEKMPFAGKLDALFHLHLHHLLNERLNPVLFLSEAVNPQNLRLLATMRKNLDYLGQAVAQILQAAKKLKQIRGDVASEALQAAILGLLQTSVIKWTLQRSTDGLLENGTRNIAELARIVSYSEVEK